MKQGRVEKTDLRWAYHLRLMTQNPDQPSTYRCRLILNRISSSAMTFSEWYEIPELSLRHFETLKDITINRTTALM